MVGGGGSPGHSVEIGLMHMAVQVIYCTTNCRVIIALLVIPVLLSVLPTLSTILS